MKATGFLFIETVLWIARTGSPWRDLPKEFGKWNSVFQRYRRWGKAGRFTRIFEEINGEPDIGIYHDRLQHRQSPPPRPDIVIMVAPAGRVSEAASSGLLG